MKRKSFLVAAVAALMMSACSNEVEQVAVDSNTAALELTVVGAAPGTRATAASVPATTDESKINQVTVGLFKTDGSVDAISEGILSSSKISVRGTAGDRNIIVVANAPAKAFAGITTIDAFRKIALSLTQTSSDLPMSGESTAAVTLEFGKSVPASVEVSRLVARVDLVSLNTDFSAAADYPNPKFELDKVFLYNAKSKSQVGVVSPATTVATSVLVHGYDGTTELATLLDKIDPTKLIENTAYTTPYFFYTYSNYFANDGTTTFGITNANKADATKLVIAGWFTPDTSVPGTKYYVYYPGVINRTQFDTSGSSTSPSAMLDNTGISRNYIYTVSATIKQMGVDSPGKFMEPAGLELTVTVADWKYMSQNINF